MNEESISLEFRLENIENARIRLCIYLIILLVSSKISSGEKNYKILYWLLA